MVSHAITFKSQTVVYLDVVVQEIRGIGIARQTSKSRRSDELSRILSDWFSKFRMYVSKHEMSQASIQRV